MEIPRTGQRKAQEAEPAPNEQTSSSGQPESSSSGISAQTDTVENGSDQSKFRFDYGWATSGGQEGEIHGGLGGNEETQSLVVGFVDRVNQRTGGPWVRLEYQTADVTLGGRNVNLDVTVDTFVTGERKEGLAAEVSIGHDTHVQLGVDYFGGLTARLEGSAKLGDVGEVHGAAEGGFAAGIIADLDIGINDQGKFNADIKVGLGIGLGFELDYGLSVDLPKAGEMALNAMGDAIASVGDWLSDVAEGTADAATQAADTAGDVYDDFNNVVADTAEAAVDAVADALDW